MLFNSFIFFIFLGVVVPLTYILPSKKAKNIFLLVASYFFYGYWDWRFLGLLLLSSIIDFIVGKALYAAEEESKRKRLLMVSLMANLGILGFFKYFNFFTASFIELSSVIGLSVDYLHLNIILPVGISFYTFQTLSYSIDIYRKKLKPSENFIDFALFVSFFPQLVAGPIERASVLLPQLSKKLAPTKVQIQEGIVLIITGLFRKVIIGDTSGKYVDQIFGNIHLYNSIELLSGLVLFSVQIYADFSGYSLIARGTAKLLGVELMVNFSQPYLSRNITEFWRRWHISLSSWLKDYLYISLGGNRKGDQRTYINLMLTMLLGGLWHGASWNFVIWGGLHGIYLAIHKMFLKDRKIDSTDSALFNLKTILNILVTYILVLFTWLFFRSTSWDNTILFIERVIDWKASEYSLFFLRITLSYLVVVLLIDLTSYKAYYNLPLFKNKGVRYGILTSMFVLTLAYMFQAESSPFIYFSF
ncbi:MBOAT family O-acyltransferase [Zobellia nedashkovskayae]|uniref:MBOAT family O-acyltransferase n=1 Tax=Zobellia nedashkovskayae TaxID=2779510 RepID=UPI00188BA893|nr:MBOAT family protein [Zobellia nedashkovskayae]